MVSLTRTKSAGGFLLGTSAPCRLAIFILMIPCAVLLWGDRGMEYGESFYENSLIRAAGAATTSNETVLVPKLAFPRTTKTTFADGGSAGVVVDYHVDESCRKLPTIRPSGSYFLDAKIKAGSSPAHITPSFKVGSYYADKVPYHMNGDASNFRLIRDLLQNHLSEGALALDFGANQGFYTYYMAALGLQVHAFEINEANFKSLQHGAEFNPREIADRVHLYPVGMGEMNARFGMRGSNYEGFLQKGKGGPILGATFDCFAYHRQGELDFSKVAFVKLDVEGFEIAVLKGAQNSLFKPGHSQIGGMIAEVGPERWGRASHDFATGVAEMKKLATHFEKSYVLTRSPGVSYAKSCPVALAKDLADKNPQKFDGVEMFLVEQQEWEPLLTKMEKKKFDCNFFYKN